MKKAIVTKEERYEGLTTATTAVRETDEETFVTSDTEDTCNHSMLYLKMNLVKVKDARQDTITTITLHANTKEKMTWQGLIKTASNKILTTTQIRGTEDTCKSPSKINLETVKCLQREVITS
jgi:hypothetical protein